MHVHHCAYVYACNYAYVCNIMYICMCPCMYIILCRPIYTCMFVYVICMYGYWLIMQDLLRNFCVNRKNSLKYYSFLSGK